MIVVGGTEGTREEDDGGLVVECIMEFVRGLACTDTVVHCCLYSIYCNRRHHAVNDYSEELPVYRRLPC